MICGVATDVKIGGVDHPGLRHDDAHGRRFSGVLYYFSTTRASCKGFCHVVGLVCRAGYRELGYKTQGATRFIYRGQFFNFWIGSRAGWNVCGAWAIYALTFADLYSFNGINRV